MDLVHGALTAILPAATVTLKITVGAWAFSAIVGLLFAIVREIGGRLFAFLISIVVTILRSLPQLVILYVVFFGLGFLKINLDSLTAAVIGLGIGDCVYSAEYYRASFLTVSAAQHEAGLSLGLSRLAIMRLIILPQAIPFLVPPLLNSFVGLMKGATLAAAIGAPEVLYAGQNYMEKTGRVAPVALVIIVLYIITTIPLTRLIGRVEARVRGQHAQAK
jgi:His/Glu/Gln/Arg/opine family amino acid ABC transporter permease subunit